MGKNCFLSYIYQEFISGNDQNLDSLNSSNLDVTFLTASMPGA